MREGASADQRPPVLLTPPPEGRRRRWVSAFIGAFVTFLILTPLGYYLRDDPYDERFAWRMFSDVRLYSCRSELVETVAEGQSRFERRPPLMKVLHYSWIQMLQRNRRAVIWALLEARCGGSGVLSTRLINTCRTTDGAALAPQRYELDCRTGERMQPTTPSDGPAAPRGGETRTR